MHAIYQALSYLLIGGLLPFLFVHPKLREGIRRRFGLYSERPWPRRVGAPETCDAAARGSVKASRAVHPPGGDLRMWLHGASAGDLMALHPIIVELRRIAPDVTIVVSTMTNSGHAIARDRLAPLVDGITYVPYDLPGCTRRAVRALAPHLLVLEYAEVWPNLIDAARRSGARIAMTNGRISEALLGRYRVLHRLIGNQLQKFDLLLMREEVEAERALVLGAHPARVIATGNTKFDNLAEPPAESDVGSLRAAFGLRDERVFVAGSTHEGEERDILRCFKRFREIDPRMRMILAPRYVERAGRLVALAGAEGLIAISRNEAERGREEGAKADVMVLDRMGELTAAYALASLVFVGGSFVPRGGQNILEPAGQGRPVLFGPNMMNFRDSVEVLLGRGGIQVQSPSQLEKVVRELLLRPEEIERLGIMAKGAVQRARGASLRNAELLLGLCERRAHP